MMRPSFLPFGSVSTFIPSGPLGSGAAECAALAERATDPRIKAFNKVQVDRWLRSAELVEKAERTSGQTLRETAACERTPMPKPRFLAGASQESARFAEAEHHLRGALSRTHRKIVARIHQRVAFGFEHKSRCGHFALDDFAIDAVQRLRIARARSSRRNIVGDDISTPRFEGGKNGPVQGVGVG